MRIVQLGPDFGWDITAQGTASLNSGAGSPSFDFDNSTVAIAGSNRQFGCSALANAAGNSFEPLFFTWELLQAPANSGASFTNPTGATSGFQPDVAGTFVLRFFVSDKKQTSAPALITINAQ